MAHALHHYLKRKYRGEKTSLLDKVIYASAFGGPLLTLPQVMKIYGEKNASGISIIYWLGILAGAILWGTYGWVHKEKPIVIANFLTAVLAIIIATGVFLFS